MSYVKSVNNVLVFFIRLEAENLVQFDIYVSGEANVNKII